MTSVKTSVSVIVPVRNESGFIVNLIEGLWNQELKDLDLEVVVCDGMSNDGTREKLANLRARYPDLRVVDNPLRITPAGLNIAINAANGDIIIRIDAHSEYASDYIQRCVETLLAIGADNVGGPWCARGRGLVSRAVAAGFQSPFAVGGARGHQLDYEGPVDTVYLGCWRRSAFERYGGFDEELVRNQDDEHNLRIIRGGGRVWQSPAIKSWYTPRDSLLALFRQYFQYGYWKVMVIQKHKLPASPRHLVPCAFVLFCALAWGVGLLHPAGWWFYGGVLGLYAILSLTYSVAASIRCGWSVFPFMPAVFGIYHIAYGSGFLLGVFDFFILRRGPRLGMTVLTRPTVPPSPAAREQVKEGHVR